MISIFPGFKKESQDGETKTLHTNMHWLINGEWNLAWHKKAFSRMQQLLPGFVSWAFAGLSILPAMMVPSLAYLLHQKKYIT